MNEDETLPPGYSRVEREKLRPWLIVSVVAGLVALCLLLSGCVSLPKCPDAQYRTGVDGSGYPVYVFDAANWARMIATFRGLAEGACKLPPTGTEV